MKLLRGSEMLKYINRSIKLNISRDYGGRNSLENIGLHHSHTADCLEHCDFRRHAV
jgi:hypothetical protein